MARSKTGRRGVAYILTIVLLAMFVAVAVAFASQTGASLQTADNQGRIQESQLQAESGTAFLCKLMRAENFSPNATPAQVLQQLSADLPTLIGAGNMNGQTIGYTNGATTLTIPFIRTQTNGHGFDAVLAIQGNNLVMTVTGRTSKPTDALPADTARVDRNARLSFNVSSGNANFFNYGVASKSRISMNGNVNITSSRNPKPKILSATYSVQDAISMTGNCGVGGDIDISNPAGQCNMTGNCSVAGIPQGNPAIASHINIGIGPVDFPKANPAVFEKFATNFIDSSTKLNGNKTFSNVRIKAGTNPNFSGNITITGVIYVEKPNNVKFSGNLNLTGVIVTEDASADHDLNDNQIQFSGNTSVQGVESLPNTPQWAELRAMPGTFLLAPGFAASFTGNFGTINGTMAADQFRFTGNAGGTITGSVINWSDSDFTMTGNAGLTINPPSNGTIPPGFGSNTTLVALPGSYQEPLKGQ